MINLTSQTVEINYVDGVQIDLTYGQACFVTSDTGKGKLIMPDPASAPDGTPLFLYHDPTDGAIVTIIAGNGIATDTVLNHGAIFFNFQGMWLCASAY